MNLSKYLSEALANWMGGADMPTPPTSLFLSLHNENPHDDDTGLEINIGGYARQVIQFDNPTQTITDYRITCANAPVFGSATASWGDVLYWGLRSPTGQLLLYGEFDATTIINIGSFFYIPVGRLVIRTIGFSDNFSASLLNWIKGVVFPSAPSQLEMALHTGNVESNDSNLNEIAGGGYVRQLIAFSNNYIPTDGYILENISHVIFPSASANWGVVSNWSIRRVDTGDLITFGYFLSPKLVEVGEGYLIESNTTKLIIS